MDNPATTADKVQLERSWLATQMAGDPSWPAYSSTHRLYAAAGRSYVAWRAVNGSPEVLEILTCTGFGLGKDTGLLIHMKPVHIDPLDATRYMHVGSKPVKIFDIFFWTPAFADVRYVPLKFSDPDSPKRVTVPLCFKMAHRPDRPLVEGCTYLQDLQTFKAQWPNAL